MKATRISSAALAAFSSLAILSSAVSSFGSDAQTSATAAAGRGRTGTAAATAHYEGDAGFARTDTRTGAVNIARAVAVGVDEHGLSFSLSTAIAPKNGRAIAANFNLSIDADGGSAHSVGQTVSIGGVRRSASAGGSTSTESNGSVAASRASGSTSFGGVVRAETRSEQHRAQPVVVRRVIRVR